MNHVKSLVALVLASSFIMGCTQQTPSSATASPAQAAPVSAVDQANLCEVKAWQHDDVAAACKPGQKVVFLPESFGNQQLPVIFAAVNCDLRYAVALTTGAVTCIYGPITPKSTQDAAPAKP